MTPTGPKTQRVTQSRATGTPQLSEEDFAADIAEARRESERQKQNATIVQRFSMPAGSRRCRVFFVLCFLWTALYLFTGASAMVAFARTAQSVGLGPVSSVKSDDPAATAAGYSLATIVAIWAPLGMPLLIAAVATIPER
jgi:hypothetical protein